METRPLGETGQVSSILTFGAIALDALEQEAANQAVEFVVNHGVNHVDVAPNYGDAEVKLSPKLNEHRDSLFLGCKTAKRTYEAAWEELELSLDRLDVDHIDLYQFHGVTESEELETIMESDGALAAFREAKEAGLIDHIGLTSHGHAELISNAIKEIGDLETIMFPMNYTVLAQEEGYRHVLNQAKAAGLGTIGIKAYAKAPWDSDGDQPYRTWYEPYDTYERLKECTNFTLSQGLTTITNAGDPKLLAGIVEAAESFDSLSEEAQKDLLDRGKTKSSPVPEI